VRGRKSADFRIGTSHKLFGFVFILLVLKAKLKDLARFVNVHKPSD